MNLNDRKQNIRYNSNFEAYPLMKLFPVALHWLKAKRSAQLAASLQALISVLIMGVLLFGGATARADTVTYIHSDLSGSPQAATDESGNLLWRESYYAYGQKTQWQPAADEQSQWFHGKEQDADTGMQYFGARYYDPSIGRFLGIDPVDYKDGNLHSFNRYAYGNNNPVKFKDPDGAYAEAALEAISLAVGLDSLGKNYVAGNYGAATVDAAGVVLDAALTAVPLAPGMVGLGIKAIRESGKASSHSIANFSRELRASDMGLQGIVTELRGSFSVQEKVATMRVDMIRGEIANPLQVVGNMADVAKANGATSLRIEGTIANERLFNVLERRYGLTSSGSKDVISIPLN